MSEKSFKLSTFLKLLDHDGEVIDEERAEKIEQHLEHIEKHDVAQYSNCKFCEAEG